jgi:hypothetical protein
MTLNAHIEVNTDAAEILKKALSPAFWGGVLQEWHRLYTPFVPMDTGQLASSVVIDAASQTITHTVPYARRQYLGDGHSFRRDRNPLAAARWDQAAAPTALERLAAFAQWWLDNELLG